MARSAIVVGASSGIGEALARELAADGYEVGLAARRTERMREIGAELSTHTYVATMDVTDVADAREGFDELVDAMDGVDLVVLCAGVAHPNRDLEWEHERETIDVNVRGFTALATAAMEHFETRSEGTGGTAQADESDGSAGADEAAEADGESDSETDSTATNASSGGHLVGISSVAARLGWDRAPAYSASKAYVSTYLAGLRNRRAGRGTGVTITTVEPGFVDTGMTLPDDSFWVTSPETAAAQIVRAIRRERNHVYVPRRWRLVAWLTKAMPERVLRQLIT